MSTPQKVAVGRRYRRAVRVVPRFLALVVLAYAVALVAYFGKYRVRPRHHHAPDLPAVLREGEIETSSARRLLCSAAPLRYDAEAGAGAGGAAEARGAGGFSSSSSSAGGGDDGRRTRRLRTRRLDVLVGRLRLRRRPPDARADQARPLPRPLARVRPARGSRPPGPQRHGRARLPRRRRLRVEPRRRRPRRALPRPLRPPQRRPARARPVRGAHARRDGPRRDRFPERRPRARIDLPRDLGGRGAALQHRRAQVGTPPRGGRRRQRLGHRRGPRRTPRRARARDRPELPRKGGPDGVLPRARGVGRPRRQKRRHATDAAAFSSSRAPPPPPPPRRRRSRPRSLCSARSARAATRTTSTSRPLANPARRV